MAARGVMSTAAVVRVLMSVASSARAGVTSDFVRPPAATPLSHDEVLLMAAGSHRSGRALGTIEEDVVQQVHVGLGGPGEAVVTFATWQRDVPRMVLYGPAGGSITRQAQSEVSTYVTHICPTNAALRAPSWTLNTNGGAPDVSDDALAELVNTSRLGLPPSSLAYTHLANASEAWAKVEKERMCVTYKNPLGYYESPYIHTAVLTGLAPRASYEYRPAGGNRTFTFAMPPKAGQSDAERPLKLAVWGDVGTTNVSFAVMKQLAAMEPDAVLLAGDYSYADGWSPKWETFGVMMEPLMARYPGLGVIGNHEIAEGNYQAIDWMHRYPQPFRQSGSESPLFYSYELGLVHVLALPGSYAPTDNQTYARPSAQYLFAAEDLARVDRSRTPWIVVMFHTPWYNSNTNHYEEGLKHQWDMEDLLFEHGVDVVLNGHVHSYERSLPVYRNEVNPCGAVHIVIGDAGNYEGPALPWQKLQPAWSAFREASFGGGLLTVHNDTHAQWEWRRTACVDRKDNEPWSWDGRAGLSGGNCSTLDDNSLDRFKAIDSAMLVRDASACPKRGSGGPERRLDRAEADVLV